MVRPVTAIAVIVLVGAAYALLIPSFQNSPDFAALNPGEQYILWNLGFAVLFSVFFGALVTAALRKGYSLKHIFVNGLTTFALFSFVLDNLSPPFAYNAQGQLLIPAGQTLEGTAVDFALGWFYSTQLNISGPALFYAVYLVTPILAIALFVYVLGLHKFLRIYGAAV